MTEKSTGTALTPAQESNVQQLVEAGNQMSIAHAAVIDSFDVIKSLGRIEAANFFTTVGDKLIAETALNIRDSKQYKGLPYKDESGNIRQVGDFPEFCKVFLGKSYTRTMELISNHNLLGADLYEQAERIGFRQRDYNALKSLPADDKLIIAQAIESEDLDKALDLMQQLAAKHQREKETTEKQLDELVKSVGAKDSVIKGKSEELDKKNEQLARLQLEKNTKINEVMMPGEYQLSRLQEYSREITARIEATLRGEIVNLLNEFPDELPVPMQLAIAQSFGMIIATARGVAHDMGIIPIEAVDEAVDDPAKILADKFMAHEAAQVAEDA
jgi:hypothetical protein